MSQAAAARTVRFAPSGRTVQVPAGTSLFEAARLAQVPLGSSCGGEGACGWCRVTVIAGAEALTPPTAREVELLGRIGAAAAERAACLARLRGQGGPVTITTSYW